MSWYLFFYHTIVVRLYDLPTSFSDLIRIVVANCHQLVILVKQTYSALSSRLSVSLHVTRQKPQIWVCKSIFAETRVNETQQYHRVWFWAKLLLPGFSVNPDMNPGYGVVNGREVPLDWAEVGPKDHVHHRVAQADWQIDWGVKVGACWSWNKRSFAKCLRGGATMNNLVSNKNPKNWNRVDGFKPRFGEMNPEAQQIENKLSHRDEFE